MRCPANKFGCGGTRFLAWRSSRLRSESFRGESEHQWHAGTSPTRSLHQPPQFDHAEVEPNSEPLSRTSSHKRTGGLQQCDVADSQVRLPDPHVFIGYAENQINGDFIKPLGRCLDRARKLIARMITTKHLQLGTIK